MKSFAIALSVAAVLSFFAIPDIHAENRRHEGTARGGNEGTHPREGGTARSLPKEMMLHLPVMGGGDSIIWISHSSRERSHRRM